MRTFVTTLGALTLTLALAATAGAQDARPAQDIAPDTNFTFDDHEVDGGRYVPDGVRVLGHGRAMRTTLVRPRVHFIPEMLKSVENL